MIKGIVSGAESGVQPTSTQTSREILPPDDGSISFQLTLSLGNFTVTCFHKGFVFGVWTFQQVNKHKHLKVFLKYVKTDKTHTAFKNDGDYVLVGSLDTLRFLNEEAAKERAKRHFHAVPFKNIYQQFKLSEIANPQARLLSLLSLLNDFNPDRVAYDQAISDKNSGHDLQLLNEFKVLEEQVRQLEPDLFDKTEEHYANYIAAVRTHIALHYENDVRQCFDGIDPDQSQQVQDCVNAVLGLEWLRDSNEFLVVLGFLKHVIDNEALAFMPGTQVCYLMVNLLTGIYDKQWSKNGKADATDSLPEVSSSGNTACKSGIKSRAAKFQRELEAIKTKAATSKKGVVSHTLMVDSAQSFLRDRFSKFADDLDTFGVEQDLETDLLVIYANVIQQYLLQARVAPIAEQVDVLIHIINQQVSAYINYAHLAINPDSDDSEKLIHKRISVGLNNLLIQNAPNILVSVGRMLEQLLNKQTVKALFKHLKKELKDRGKLPDNSNQIVSALIVALKNVLSQGVLVSKMNARIFRSTLLIGKKELSKPDNSSVQDDIENAGQKASVSTSSASTTTRRPTENVGLRLSPRMSHGLAMDIRNSLDDFDSGLTLNMNDAKHHQMSSTNPMEHYPRQTALNQFSMVAPLSMHHEEGLSSGLTNGFERFRRSSDAVKLSSSPTHGNFDANVSASTRDKFRTQMTLQQRKVNRTAK